MQLLGNRLIIKKVTDEGMAKGGIILRQSTEQPSIADVVEVSSDTVQPFKVGDRIVYERYSGMDVELGELGKVTIIPGAAVVALVLEDEKC